MADPTLKRASVKIAYSASDGYRSEVAYVSGRSNTPEAMLVEAADELGRLAELFGFGAKASEALEGARLRVRNWRAEREGGTA